MPNRDTYRVVCTVRDDYEDEPHFSFEHKEYLSPGQTAMASVLRSAALELGPEDEDTRSGTAIYAALDAARARTMKEGVGPATRNLLVEQLWQLAESLNIEWYGFRP